MSVNGITNYSANYGNYETKAKAPAEKAENTSAETNKDTGVVYEPSKTETTDTAKKVYKPDTA